MQTEITTLDRLRELNIRNHDRLLGKAREPEDTYELGTQVLMRYGREIHFLWDNADDLIGATSAMVEIWAVSKQANAERALLEISDELVDYRSIHSGSFVPLAEALRTADDEVLASRQIEIDRVQMCKPVSYTHLTLPTIYSV